MRKLLHIIESLETGGAEQLLVGVINGLKGYEHHVIILDDKESLRSSITVPIKFLNLAIVSKTDFIRSVSKVKEYIKQNEIGTVHAHLYRANILSRLATPKKIPLFNSIHAISSEAAYKDSKLTLYIERLTYRKRHHIIAVSKEVLNDFEKYVGIKGPATVLYNFIEEEFFAPATKTEFRTKPLRLVAVGNLRHQKNYPYLIEAFKNAPADVSLDIYGEGKLRSQLQKQIDEHSLNIRLCGLHREMHNILPRYDAFVMSSFYEGQPLSLLEAMACGLPALLSDIPVLHEVTGEDALYFDINDPSSLAAQIERIRNNKVDLPKLSAAGLRRVNAFAHKAQYLQKLRDLYEEV
jgi:glycosyltransferase involved in cell wall biosynthesis